MRTGPSRRAEGVALLIVLVVLVLIATLATEIAITAKTSHRLAEHSMEDLLLRSSVDGRVEILKSALRYDATSSSTYDGEADEWSWHANETKKKLSSWGERGTATAGQSSDAAAAGTASFKNTDVQLTAWCEDERSKISLRGLMKPEGSEAFKHTKEALIRLIDVFRENKSSLDLSEGDAKEMVDDLVKWLQAESDTEDNPMPAVKPNRGRLQSIDDLLRVPGGHWTPERLYDVKDPDESDESDPSVRSSSSTSGASSSSSGSTTSSDGTGWEWANGVPGLGRYLTVYDDTTTPDPKPGININTAPAVVLKALFEANDDDLAAKIVEYRRQGADDASSGTLGAGTDPKPSDTAQGFFKAKADLTKVEGLDKFSKESFPRLDFFAEVASSVYSLRVIAKVLRKSSGASSGDDSEAPKQIDAVYQYRQVVQRRPPDKASKSPEFITLFTERRNDPIFGR